MICYIGVGSHHQNRKRKSNDLTCRHSLARSNKKDGFVATSNGLVRGLSMEQDATEGFQNGTIGNLLWMQVRLMTIEKCTCVGMPSICIGSGNSRWKETTNKVAT
jgi:hypothetical protein